jgi:sugar phosphate isomerase/epimerase
MNRYSMSRRGFLTASASLPLAAARFEQPLGVQMYTVRDILPKQPRETIAALAKTGYAEVEILRGDMRVVAPLLKEFKLKAPSGHFEAPLVTGNWEPWRPFLGDTVPKGYDWARAIEDAKSWGLRYMVISYLMPSERGGLDFYRAFADKMNRAGEPVKKAGLTLCYHHHSFEFAPAGGQRPIDVLLERFDPKLVQIEGDVFWMKVAGEDPAAMLRRLKGRIPLIHLKDIAAGTATSFDEQKVPPAAFREAGSGSLDFPAVLRACAEAGVRHYVVEQDHCAGSPLESVEKSYRFLRSVSL